jgi:hypothetical protein
VALAVVLLLDRIFFGVIAPWGALAERVGPTERPHHQVARSRGAIRDLAAAASDGPTAFVALRPFEMRSLTDDLIRTGADAAVLMLSEFDTHRPIRLDPMPGTSAASVGALAEFLNLAGPRFAFENRPLLYRVPLSRVLDAYRFREILRRAGLDALREFHLDEERHWTRAAPLSRPAAMGGGTKRKPSPDLIERVVAGFPERRRRAARYQIWMIAEMGAGAHVRVQKQLIRSAVARLRTAGVQVVVAEGPLHPDAASFYDARLRDDFLAFADALREEFDIRLLPLEAFGRLSPSDFGDMLHLNARGAPRFTRVVVDAVGQVLGRRGGPGSRHRSTAALRASASAERVPLTRREPGSLRRARVPHHQAGQLAEEARLALDRLAGEQVLLEGLAQKRCHREVAEYQVEPGRDDQRELGLFPGRVRVALHLGYALGDQRPDPLPGQAGEAFSPVAGLVLDESRKIGRAGQAPHDRSDDLLHGVGGVALGGELLEQLQQGTNAALEHGLVERLLAGEVVVETGRSKAGRLGDLAHAGSGEPVLGEERLGGV